MKKSETAAKPTITRGKYANLIKQGSNLVILDPALLPYFPDSASVNRALHAFLAINDQVQSATTVALGVVPSVRISRVRSPSRRSFTR